MVFTFLKRSEWAVIGFRARYVQNKAKMGHPGAIIQSLPARLAACGFRWPRRSDDESGARRCPEGRPSHVELEQHVPQHRQAQPDDVVVVAFNALDEWPGETVDCESTSNV